MDEDDRTPPASPRLLEFAYRSPSPARLDIFGASAVINLDTPSPRAAGLSLLRTPLPIAPSPSSRPYNSLLDLLGDSVSPVRPRAEFLHDALIPPVDCPDYLAPKARAKSRPKGRPSNPKPAEPKRAPKFR